MSERQEGLRSLTIQQIHFLTDLEKLDKKRGAVRMIAGNYGVNHSIVSRFFSSCVEEGYLTEQFLFTEKGTRMLQWNRKVVNDVKNYLIRNGLTDGIDDVLKGMVEHIDYVKLEELVKNSAGADNGKSLIKQQEELTDITKVLEYGSHEVVITILSHDGSRLSMADRGFEPIALIRHNKRGSYLELSIREMEAISRASGMDMFGHLSSLKYMHQGIYRYAEIKDNRVRIPLKACTYQYFDHGMIRGNVMITVTCSVGEEHMPESTARLIFKL